MLQKFMVCVVLLAGLVWLAGCDRSETSTSAAGLSSLVVKAEPAGAIPVGTARTQVKDGEAVVLTGRIGGSAQPFISGAAAFTIVDPSVKWCAEAEGCPTPWDYCCTQNEVRENIATVKIVDAAGGLVSGDARQMLGVKELSLIVVAGRAERDAAGNLAVRAEQVFVRE